MRLLIDSDVGIHWRDGHPGIRTRIAEQVTTPVMSIITRVELENGVYRDASIAHFKRAALQAILAHVTVLPFDDVAMDVYSAILAATGYSRSKVHDRMIAATAIAHGLPLATINANDFRDITSLELQDWGSTVRP